VEYITQLYKLSMTNCGTQEFTSIPKSYKLQQNPGTSTQIFTKDEAISKLFTKKNSVGCDMLDLKLFSSGSGGTEINSAHVMASNFDLTTFASRQTIKISHLAATS
jgi:hypothetical protein